MPFTISNTAVSRYSGQKYSGLLRESCHPPKKQLSGLFFIFAYFPENYRVFLKNAVILVCFFGELFMRMAIKVHACQFVKKILFWDLQATENIEKVGPKLVTSIVKMKLSASLFRQQNERAENKGLKKHIYSPLYLSMLF